MTATTPFLPLLARVMAGPLVWIAHFTLVYVTIAVMCARPDGMSHLSHVLGATPHGVLHAAVGILTILAMMVLAWSLRPFALRRPHASNASTRFMVWTTLAMALLSVAALATNALVALSYSDCSG